jgi:hypothetical protein
MKNRALMLAELEATDSGKIWNRRSITDGAHRRGLALDSY